MISPANLKLDIEAEEVRKNVRLLDDPIAGLKNKDERLHNALRLMARYNYPRHRGEKRVDLPTDESKLIVEALAAQVRFKDPDMSAVETAILWCHLSDFGCTIQSPTIDSTEADFDAYFAARGKWMLENAGKVHIQRYAPK